MKVILSRIGFDSSVGGKPSPHFIETGRLLSLPIPEDDNNQIDTGKTYSDLRIDEQITYLDIMKLRPHAFFLHGQAIQKII